MKNHIRRGVCNKDFPHHNRQPSFAWLILILSFVFTLGCENISKPESTNDVTAHWSEDDQSLHVSGSAPTSLESIEIHDAASNTLLGKAIVKADGTWSAIASTAACEIHVTLPSGQQTFSVADAPDNCTGSSSYARAISAGGVITAAADIPENVLFDNNPVILNTVPNAVILSPPQNISINAGQIVNFQGIAVGSGVTPPFSYTWNFGGAAPNSTIQNPGSIRFDVPGTYFIQLSAMDNLGIPDPTPAVRTITVNGPNFPNNTIPIPSITSPIATNGIVTANVGESIFFSGTATDGSGINSFTYEWDFSGVYPTQFGSTAGSIPFSREGTYLVSLYATNAQGIRSTTPAMVTILVSPTVGVNQAPTGTITRPRNDVTIQAGEALNFRARGQDPDNTLPLYYSWDFQGVAPPISMSPDNTAGRVTFSNPGVYYVKLTVSDSAGSSDPNPPVRVVTVLSDATPPPGNGTLNSQITSPASDITISPGQSVFFSGQVATPTNVPGPLQYYWSFGGAAVDSTLQSPGSITFPNPGQYFVTFTAMDNFGNSVGAPSSRTITVVDPSTVNVNITSPQDRTTISLGQTISLIGQVGNNSGFTNLSYRWTIKQRGADGNIFRSTQLSPGTYTFSQPGEYVVRFRVRGTDPFGNPTVNTTAKSRITVSGVGTVPPIPGTANTGAAIMLPTSDMVIYTGNQVDFEANTIVGSNINYAWDFSGARSPSSRRNPRPITFETAGTYFVTLRVTGSVNGLPLNLFDQRTITVLQQNPSFPPVPTPGSNGTGIMLPITDQVINVGQSVDFEANTVVGNNIAYNWDFGGARSPSSRRNPRPVTFNTPGNYLITLLTTGTATNGFPINSFDQRNITVLQSTNPFPPGGNPLPLGTGILSPASDTVINIGNSVNFEASLISGGNNISYQWDFGTVRSPSNRRTPSNVRFNNPGSYLVSVRITGTVNGLPFNAFDQRVITVLQTGGGFPPTPPLPPVNGNSMPEGFIVEPAQSVISTRVGQSVRFSGNGFDPLGIGALTFQWSFGGAQRNIVAQTPGSISFNRPGTYVVSLLVQNAAGQFDSTPPTVVVSVTP